MDRFAIVPLQTVSVPGSGGIDVALSLGTSAVGAFFTTLVVGAILVALAPDYTEGRIEALRQDPVGSFVYGLVCLVFVVLVTLVLVFIIVGILVAIPVALLTFAIWAVGAAIAYLAIAVQLVDSEDGWLRPLIVAAAINGGLTLTGVGGLIAFCIGATGFGAILREYLG